MVGASGLQRSDNIMPHLPQGFDHEAMKILVGIKTGHDGSFFLVLADRLIDLRRMFLHIGPCRSQITGAERRVVAQQFVIRKAEPARLLQGPDRDARAGDAGITTSDPGRVLNASRRGIVALLDEEQKIQHVLLQRLRGRLQFVQKRGV